MRSRCGPLLARYTGEEKETLCARLGVRVRVAQTGGRRRRCDARASLGRVLTDLVSTEFISHTGSRSIVSLKPQSARDAAEPGVARGETGRDRGHARQGGQRERPPRARKRNFQRNLQRN